ncbi:MAG: Ni/Fe-hydrogenase cytochrome b subunit [Acidobacteria bacterium]|nr:Ni/Fe-hydrogenase cytochrome b subunit [Acidobacteriota bacterium]
MRRFIPKTFWHWVFALLMLGGAYATVIRIVYGLGGSTNLSDKFPWGIWVGFDVLCGVGLAAGGFTLAATVHIFNIKRYKPIVRPAILTAFLGYLLVIFALMFDLGKPYNVWHPLIMWNPHSVMFEVGWCVTLYTTVLSLEFAPVLCERFGWHTPIRWLHKVEVPLIIVGILLSTLHQSSLGTLYLIMPHKLYPLWYSPLMPIFFYVSAIAVGLAMTIFESWHSSRAFGRQIELSLLQGLARVLAVLLSFYLMMRFLDLLQRDVLHLLSVPRMETYLFGLEIVLLLLPAMLLFRRHIRASPGALYACSVMVVFGFITNRLNVSLTGMEAGSGTHYIPKWTEIMVTVSIVAFGFFIFRMAAKHLPIFVDEEEHSGHAGVFGSPLAAAGRK